MQLAHQSSSWEPRKNNISIHIVASLVAVLLLFAANPPAFQLCLLLLKDIFYRGSQASSQATKQLCSCPGNWASPMVVTLFREMKTINGHKLKLTFQSLGSVLLSHTKRIENPTLPKHKGTHNIPSHRNSWPFFFFGRCHCCELTGLPRWGSVVLQLRVNFQHPTAHLLGYRHSIFLNLWSTKVTKESMFECLISVWCFDGINFHAFWPIVLTSRSGRKDFAKGQKDNFLNVEILQRRLVWNYACTRGVISGASTLFSIVFPNLHCSA